MKNILIDTHVALWFLNGDSSLSDKAKGVILDARNNKYVSLASVWEVAIKISINKLSFDGGTEGFVELLKDNGFELLPIKTEHLSVVETLEFFHRDPFDRLLVAACIAEDMPIVTVDKNIELYPIESLA
jgi:PIN domain nuclease of toxin-antitoxin system